MPVRGNTKPRTEQAQETEQFEYSYDEVVELLRQRMEDQFGGVAKFLDSPEYASTGLGTDKKDKAKIYTYLSAPTAKTKRVKSFPVVQKLLSVMIKNISLQEERKTIIQHKIFSDTKL